ncbi:hypothetical protein FRC17_009818 [Serendipita sp. 399]|nr:hypothetical protein FRC17_009818 [Serendipita sp. 399]
MIDAPPSVDETAPLEMFDVEVEQAPEIPPFSSGLNEETPADSQQEAHPVLEPARRRLPQRTRKVGFGTHDVDSLIVQAIESDEKLKGSIPPETMIHCTTDSKALPNAQDIIDQIKFGHDSDVEGNSAQEEEPNLSLHSYFRSVEVMQSLRRQTQIETGKFELVTPSMIADALQGIPDDLLHKPPDLLDDTFRRRHMRAQKVETRSRIREKELLNRDVSRLQDRISQLEAMDLNGFRGETGEEQERDKQKILSYARQMISRSNNQYRSPSVSEPDLDGLGPHASHRSEKKPKANGATRKSKPKSIAEEVGENGLPIYKPKKEPKVSQFIYVDDYYDAEDPVSPRLRHGRDDDYIEMAPKKKKKSKKGANLGKRKRDADYEMEYMVLPEVVAVPRKKPKGATSSIKKRIAINPIHHKPPADRASSKLLEQSNKYNPNRASRDTLPFGVYVPAQATDIHDFDLPDWVTYEPNSVDMEDQRSDREDGDPSEEPSPDRERVDESRTLEDSTIADEREGVDELEEDAEGESVSEEVIYEREEVASSSLSPIEDSDGGRQGIKSGIETQDHLPGLEGEQEQQWQLEQEQGQGQMQEQEVSF